MPDGFKTHITAIKENTASDFVFQKIQYRRKTQAKEE